MREKCENFAMMKPHIRVASAACIGGTVGFSVYFS